MASRLPSASWMDSLDLVLPAHQNGSGVFTGQSLTCELGDDCCEALDESTGTSASEVEVVTTLGTYKSNLSVALTVPGNTSTAQIMVRYAVRDPGNWTALGKPPAVSVDVPPAVSRSSPTTLAATVTDPNGDRDTVRRYVDGVLLAPSTSTLLFTSGHELRVVARDLRGETTSAKKVVQCLWPSRKLSRPMCSALFLLATAACGPRIARLQPVGARNVLDRARCRDYFHRVGSRKIHLRRGGPRSTRPDQRVWS